MNKISSTHTSNNTDDLSANDIIDKNIRNLKIKFGIHNIPIKNDKLPNMCWMPKMHKKPIKDRFLIASPKSSIKTSASSIKSIFRLFFRQIQTYNGKYRFCTGINTFLVVQNNIAVIVAMNRLYKRRKATFIQPLTFLPCILNFHIINF